MTKPVANPKKRGRKPGTQPVRVSRETFEAVITAYEAGSLLCDVCAEKGITVCAFNRAKERYPDLAQRLLRARTDWAYAQVEKAIKLTDRRHQVQESRTVTEGGKDGTVTATKYADDLARDKLRAEIRMKAAQLHIGQIMQAQIRLSGDKEAPIRIEQELPPLTVDQVLEIARMKYDDDADKA